MKIIKNIFSIALFCALSFVITSVSIFDGPFPSVKQYIMETLGTTMHAYLLRPLSLDQVSEAQIQSFNDKLFTSKPTPVPVNMSSTNNQFVRIKDPTIQVQTVTTARYTADIMFIRDPKRLVVGITKYEGKVGQTVSDMVREYGAVGGVNGGAFTGGYYGGTGGVASGITIINGKVVTDNDGPDAQQMIGFTAQGTLIAGNYTLAQLQQMDVTQAMSFGPVLVQNGKGVVQGDGGWGYSARTAIGQMANGTVILIVTDGRTPYHIGATLADLQNMMLQYGAVTAANLDGGSSSTMFYQGRLINDPIDVLGEREVATSFLIMPEAGGLQ